MNKKETKKLIAISLLQQKHQIVNRLPKRSDFDVSDVILIKSVLGPWPRALEAADLKEPPSFTSAEKNKLKRVKAKRKKRKTKCRHKEANQKISGGNEK